MKLLRLNTEQANFLAAVRAAMERYFGDDRRRIDHALKVTGFAEEMLDYIEADPVLTLASAYLHDIGIHEAERRHGSSAGNWQEVEGPPIARRLLRDIGADEDLARAVCELIGSHHTRGGVDSPEFRILWDADALVNFAETLPGRPREQIEEILYRHMATEPGYQRAKQMFLTPSSGRGAAPCSGSKSSVAD